MNNFHYSPTRNAFYSEINHEQYVNADTWPDDAVAVNESVYMEFALADAPEGQMRVAGADGLPAWGDIPSPSKEEMIAQAGAEKSRLRAIADSEIAWRQDAVDAEIATEVETESLAKWRQYRVLLMRVNTTKPDWPPLPE